MLGEAYLDSLRDFGCCRCFKVEKVRRAIRKMSGGERPDLMRFWWEFGVTLTMQVWSR